MGTCQDSIGTCSRLIEAAGKLFAERGFTAVGVRDIAGAAGVPLGTMNYHFQGKDGLYRETLRRACERTSPQPEQIESLLRLPPEEGLRHYLRSFRSRYGLNRGWEIALIYRECNAPGPFFNEIMPEYFARKRNLLARLIGAMNGAPPDSTETQFAAVTLMAQVNMFVINRHLIHQIAPELEQLAATNPDWLEDRLLRPFQK